MKIRTFMLVVAMAALLPGSLAFAQEPVVGVKDPEALFNDKDPKLNRNKQAALHIERELLQCGQWDRAGEWLTQAYHQHNPNAASGSERSIDTITSRQCAYMTSSESWYLSSRPLASVAAWLRFG